MKKLFTITILMAVMTFSLQAQLGIGGTLTTGIDLLQTPILNSERVFNVNGNAFTVYPAVYYGINDEMSISFELGASLSFISKNNSKGESDTDIGFSVPILAKVNFGSAANTGNDCSRWGYYFGAGRQWYNDFKIHGTTTTSFVTYFAEVGGTINANSPLAIGVFSRLGFGAESSRAFQLGLTFTYNHVDDGCK